MVLYTIWRIFSLLLSLSFSKTTEVWPDSISLKKYILERREERFSYLFDRVRIRKKVRLACIKMDDFEIQNIGGGGDAFMDAEEENFQIHVRVQQRNGRKCTTSIEGLHLIPFPGDKFKGIDFKKIVRSMKRNFKCNGATRHDKKSDTTVIQLQGDQSENITSWLVDFAELCKKNQIVIHGV